MKVPDEGTYFFLLLLCCAITIGCMGNPLSTNSSGSDVISVTPINGTPVVFNESNNGKTYAIPQGTIFWINLTETFATNAPWQVTFSPGLEQMSSDYYANPAMPRFDIGGTHRWVFKAKELGMQKFNGVNGYCVKGDPQCLYNLSFQVNGKSG